MTSPDTKPKAEASAVEVLRATPVMIAAAWEAWRVRHQGQIGPGPGFVEAINAAFSAIALQSSSSAEAELRERLQATLDAEMEISAEREQRATAAEAERDALRPALLLAEAALADIGDADREPGDDLAWCERRAAEPLQKIRTALNHGKGEDARAAIARDQDERQQDAG